MRPTPHPTLPRPRTFPSPVVNAALPTTRRRAAARPGDAVEIAPGVLWLRMPLPFALDHINLWLLADDERMPRFVDCGYGDARDPRAVGAPCRDHAPDRCRSGASSRRTTIPTTSATRAWLSQRFGAPVAMTTRRVPDRPCGRRAASAGIRREATIELFRRHGMAGRRPRRARANEATATGAACPELPQSFDPMLAGDTRRAGGHERGGSSRGHWAFAGARVALLARSAAC